MARALFNAHIFLYRKTEGNILEYALFKRSDLGFWQGISGGGENNETPLETAKRELYEETGISTDSEYIQLDTTHSIPVTEFSVTHWPEDLFIIIQYNFGAYVGDREIVLSQEHTEYKWMKYEQAHELVEFDGNKIALWELDRKLKGLGPRD